MALLLAIESSCDETSAAVLRDGKILSNIISSQPGHALYGGVIPELASRLHQQQIVRVVEEALEKALITKKELNAVAFTRGPGLMGALIVGISFAKSFAWALGIPLIEIDHMEAHVMANFLEKNPPEYPFLCLTVSGGHTQLVHCTAPLEMEIIGQTTDDAAGEAFDKAAKLLGFPYPGGPFIDKHAQNGNAKAFSFTRPAIPGFDFSFSGIKTQFLYLLRDKIAENPDFVKENLDDLCAAWQRRIVTILIHKTLAAGRELKVKHIALAGGVAANSGLRKAFFEMCDSQNWSAHVPSFEYCTDNAGMIAIAGYYKYLKNEFCGLDVMPFVN